MRCMKASRKKKTNTNIDPEDLKWAQQSHHIPEFGWNGGFTPHLWFHPAPLVPPPDPPNGRNPRGKRPGNRSPEPKTWRFYWNSWRSWRFRQSYHPNTGGLTWLTKQELEVYRNFSLACAWKLLTSKKKWLNQAIQVVTGRPVVGKARHRAGWWNLKQRSNGSVFWGLIPNGPMAQWDEQRRNSDRDLQI